MVINEAFYMHHKAKKNSVKSQKCLAVLGRRFFNSSNGLKIGRYYRQFKKIGTSFLIESFSWKNKSLKKQYQCKFDKMLLKTDCVQKGADFSIKVKKNIKSRSMGKTNERKGIKILPYY